MAYRVVWSPRAVEDLEAIAQYIAMDSSAYAAGVVKRVLNIARYLSRFPYARRIVPEFEDENFASGSSIPIELFIESRTRL